MRRRILAVLMSLCMLVVLLPTTVFAWSGDGGQKRNYDAYFYVLKPSVADATVTDPQNFYYVGKGSSNTDIAVTDFTGNSVKEHISTWPNSSESDLDQIGAGEIKDKVGEDFGNVLWYRIKTASGANSNDPNHPAADSTEQTIHVDGLLKPDPSQYTVLFALKNDDGSINSIVHSATIPGQQPIGENIVNTANTAALQAENKSADQWNVTWKDENGTTVDVTDKTGTGGQILIYYADLSEKTVTYTVTYDANNGRGPVPEDREQYSGYDIVWVQFNPEPTREGYEFLGWAYDKDAANPNFSNEGTTKAFHILQNTTLYAVWKQNAPTYTLTYDANGGIDGPDPVTFTAAQEGYALDTVNVPTNARAADGRSVVFAGWTTTRDEHIYRAGESAPETVTAVDVNGPVTVYALWGYSEDGDSIADVNEIVIKPADITIYTGGEGYDASAVVDVNGNELFDTTDEDYTGLPVPGFYITLPTALNKQLRQAAGMADSNTDPVDLTDYLSFEGYDSNKEPTEDTWSLTLYNPESENNIAFEKFIYRIVAGSNSADVRLLIQDEETGDVVPSDRFTLSKDNLYQEYTISIYPGDVDQDRIKAVIALAGADDYGIFIDQGTLVVRGVNEQDPTKQILSAEPETAVNDITAVKDAEATFYTNESKIEVRDPTKVELLADSVLDDSDTLSKLRQAAADSLNNAGVTIGANTIFDFQYLDLVDASNGNAYVTTTNKLDIYWPVPDDADPKGDFSVVHFNGLDRNYSVSELATLIDTDGHEVEVYSLGSGLTIETIGNQKYVKFSTSTFSPFALVYETKTTPPQQTVTVTFKVVNGTWSNGSSSNIEVPVPKDGSLTTSQIPTGMKPNSGYEGGSWDTTPNTNRKLNSNVTYTYTFTKSDDTEPENDDCILYFESNGGTEFKKIDNGKDSFRINPYSDSKYGQHIPSRPGYRFTGWYRDEDLKNRIDGTFNVYTIVTIYAGWERTSVPSMLNGDDHYAYIQGYADGTVRPNANITRAQVATIFFRLLDEDVRSDYLTTYNPFPDVNADYWANTAISTMASLGVINGRNSGLFDPDAYITRAEFAAICARFDDSDASGFDSFTDTFGHWAEEEIGRAAALGWIQGYDDGTFRPNQYITRAQAVTMINRVLCRLPEDEDDLLPGMSVWTDCREGDWCYLAIQEATNSHDYVTKDRVYETWTDLNRAPDWSRYE